ncbi:MAG: YceH family protein [Armatimonadota bacterium]
MILLNEIEVRVLGSLVEKSLTTPEYYPLTLNALVNACNQKNNREPVTTYDSIIVNDALVSLKDKGLVRIMMGGDSRVPKYRQYFEEAYGLDPREAAVLNVLMLRGPQTVGELRGRTERMYAFAETGEVEAVLDALAQRPEPLVVKLPRLPGQKDPRYAHLLSGEPVIPEVDAATEPARPRGERLQLLEEEVAQLRQELADLRAELAEFRRQFE